MFMKADILTNIFFWLVEYWYIIVVCGVIVCLLINESTRKITFKVLCGIFLFLLTMNVILLGCMWIFGVDNGFFIGWLVIFHLLFLVLICGWTSVLRRIIRLHKHGSRTYGTLIRQSASMRASSVVEYNVDGKKYECYSHSPLRKYKIGCNEVPVVYDTEKPENSCIEKQDFIPTTALLITYGIFETGMIVLTVYSCFHI